MKMVNPREAELVEYYDQHLGYHSCCEPQELVKIFEEQLFRLCRTYKDRWILEPGCGDGRMSMALASQLGFHVDGYDCSEARVAAAEQEAQERNLVWTHYKVADISNPEFSEPLKSDQRYDLIMLFETLEHLENPLELLQRLVKNQLKPEGRVIGSVPIRMPDKAHLQVYQNAADVEERLKVSIIHQRGPFAFFTDDKRLARA